MGMSMSKAETKFLKSLDEYAARFGEALPVYPRESEVANRLEAAGVIVINRNAVAGWSACRKQ